MDGLDSLNKKHSDLLNRYDEFVRTQKCSTSVPEFADLNEPKALAQTFVKFFGEKYDSGTYRATDAPHLEELEAGRLLSINSFRFLFDAVAKQSQLGELLATLN